MRPPLPRALRDVGKRRLNYEPIATLALVTPWILVMLGSMAPMLPLLASAPLVPPLGFMLLLGWQMLRPGLFPAWAGFPLGLFDDLFSGQPFGSAALLWSIAVLILELIEFRIPWRNFFQNWLISAALMISYVLLSAMFALGAAASSNFLQLGPQIILTVLLIPLTGRITALFDRFRLLPLKNVG